MTCRSRPSSSSEPTAPSPADGNATIIKGDVAAEVAKLKEQPGQDLLIYGSGDLVDTLTRHGLIDEYRP